MGWAIVRKNKTDTCRDYAPPSDLGMVQALFDGIMTRGVAETLASRAVSGGVRELRAAQ
jgi:hypothetical protein